MRKKAFIVYLLVLFAVFGFITIRKEILLNSKHSVYIKLAPVDPRSLMQGDYMRLRYAIARKIPLITKAMFLVTTVTGYLNEKSILVGFDLEEPHFKKHKIRLNKDSKAKLRPVKIRIKILNGEFQIGANSFFFQEGKRKDFIKARYGVYKLAENGDLLLYGMANKKLEAIQ